jgi:hypothetical protein
MNILTKLLKRKGIEKIEDLSTDERVVFDNYKATLAKEQLTIEDFKRFLETQVEIIKGKWTNYDLENTKKAELIPYFTTYSTLLNIIDSPRQERETLERHLNQLINQE